MRTNPEKGAEFAAQLVNDENGPLVDVERVRFPSFDFLLYANWWIGCRHFHVSEHDSAGHFILVGCAEGE